MPPLTLRSIVALALLVVPFSLRAQTRPTGGVQTEAAQGQCLPEDEPCGGGGTPSVTVLPDDGTMNVTAGTTGNVAEFTVTNNYGSSYVYALSCATVSVGSCTAIKNAGGTTITSINLAAGGTAEITVVFTATGSPTSGTVKLTASNGIWSDNGTYAVTVLAPPAPAAVSATLWNHNRAGIDRGLCFTAGAGAAAGTSCGDLFITHGMPAYRTMGRDRSLAVLYNSAAARGQVLAAAKVTQPANSATPTRLTGVLRIGGLRDSADYAGVTAGSSAQVVLGDRLANTLATGVYVDTLVLRNSYPGSVIETMVIDTAVVVNHRNSEYGRGWSLVGVERLLLSQPSGSQDLLWVAGDGSALRYRRIAVDTFVAPAADFRDTITYNAGTQKYTRRLRHKVQVVYDVTGRHLQTINRYGQVTQFVYDTVSSVIRLSRIRMPGNDAVTREYRLFYSAAPARLLDSIADPGGRKLKLTRSGTAVTAIADPDGQQTQFVYGGPDSLLSARRVPNPVVSGGWAQTSYVYAGRSKLARARIQAGPTGLDSTVIKYVAWQANGLDTLASGLVAPGWQVWPVEGFPSTVDGPIAGIGDRYLAWVDRFGAPTRTTLEGTGAVTTFFRDSTAMPALVTRMQLPNGRWVSLRYNARGNLVMQRDSTQHLDGRPTNVSTWIYGNSTFPDTPTAVADLFGRTTTSVLHSTFGVPTSVTDPRGHTTTFSFLTSGLVQSVSELNVETWVQSTRSEESRAQTTTFEYDGMGQVRKTVAPNGAFTVWQSDSLGRVVAAWDPFNTRTQYAYDPMNRVRTQTVDSGAVANPLGASNNCVAAEFICGTAPSAWPAGTAATFVTSSYYGQVGLDSVVAPRSVPRGFRYNAAGAQTQELDHNTATSTRTFLNGAGLVDSTVSRDSQVVRFGYDAVGRLAWKAWPARTWSALYDDGKLARPAATVQGDSLVYSYDLEGRLLSVRGTKVGADTVVRTYWANGAVRSVVSTKLLLDSLLFWYDSAGALERKVHVTVVGSQVARDTTIYVTDRSTGTLVALIFAVAQPSAKAGRRQVDFTWDALGRRRSVTYPSGHPVTLRYDAAGIMRRLVSGEPGLDGSPNCGGYPNNNLCVSVANDSVDLRGNILHTDMWCQGVQHPGYACGSSANRAITNSYYRTGWLARQLDGYHSDSTITYDQSGSIIRRWDYDLRKWHNFSYQARTNRLVRDSTGPAYIYWSGSCSFDSCIDSVLVERYSWTTYNAAGSRITDSTTRVRRSPSDPERPGPGYSDRYYYYDALGRTTGIVHFDPYHWTSDGNGNAWYTPVGGGNDCLYDVEGRMVRACGSGTDVAYDGANVSATNNGIWHFLHGPGTDDPLIGIGQQPGGANVPTKEFYWVTDGQGRQYAMAEATGGWEQDFNADSWPGFPQAGGITDAMGYNAGRSQGSDVPGVSYFRNRIYDQQSGQWTQEDPIGLAGGLNLYQYAGGNPAMFTDPFGLCPEWKTGKKCKEIIAGGLVPADTKMASGVGGAEFGYTRSGGKQYHNGFDNKADAGTPVRAPADGTLTRGGSAKDRVAGRYVTLDMGGGDKVQVLHLSAWTRELMGRESVQVKAGDVMGYVGRSGNLARAPGETHGHIMTYSNGHLCNPRNFLGSEQGDCR